MFPAVPLYPHYQIIRDASLFLGKTSRMIASDVVIPLLGITCALRSTDSVIAWDHSAIETVVNTYCNWCWAAGKSDVLSSMIENGDLAEYYKKAALYGIASVIAGAIAIVEKDDLTSASWLVVRAIMTHVTVIYASMDRPSVSEGASRKKILRWGLKTAVGFATGAGVAIWQGTTSFKSIALATGAGALASRITNKIMKCFVSRLAL